MPPPEDIDGLTPAELKDLVLKLLEKVAALERTVAAQRDEIARLKGGPGRPNIKPNSEPSGMEQATDPNPPGGSGQERRRRGSTRSKLSIDEERKVRLTAPPPGSRFKGYTSFVVQDLVLGLHVVDFQCERWQAPDGKVMTAPLPPGIAGHFGPQLRRFVLTQYHQGQTTVPRLVTLLQALGIDISKREVVRLLTAGQDGFRDEARDVLRAGLASGAWITVDDTGARHKARNSFCTQIGNAHFTAFVTTAAKSRLNFLGLLRAGHGDYVVNDAALAYMRERALAGHVIARLTEHPDRYFADQQAWTAHLEKLGIAALKVNPDPVLIATEGALWGSVQAHGFLCDSVIISDDAGQFNVGQHGLCWVHAERLVHKLDTFTDQNRAAQATVRAAIWQLYRDLKAYRAHRAAQGRPCGRVRSHLHQQNRLRHPRPPARAAACQQGGVAQGARSARDSAAHQRLRKRHPLPRHQTQSLRRHPQRSRPRLSRRLPRPRQDLRQARHHLLGLPRGTARHPRRSHHLAAPPVDPRPSQTALTATTFAPVTKPGGDGGIRTLDTP